MHLNHFIRLSVLIAFLLIHWASFAQVKSLTPKELYQLDSQQFFHRIKNLALSQKSFDPGSVIPPKKSPAFAPLGQTSCFDTSGVFKIGKDKHYLYVSFAYQTKKGDILVSGSIGDTSIHGKLKGLMIKLDSKGNIAWTRIIDSITSPKAYSYFNYYKIIELKNGDLLWAGTTNNYQTENDDLLFTRTDANGNIIWSKTYFSRLWPHGSGGSSSFYIQQIREDPANDDIYFCGSHWEEGKNLTRLNGLNGTVIWSRLYEPSMESVFDRASGIIVLPNEILYFGSFNIYTDVLTSIYRINKSTGDTISTRFLSVDHPDGVNLAFIKTGEAVQLNNGHYALSGMAFGFDLNYQKPGTYNYLASTMEIDQQLNVVNAYTFRSSFYSNYYYTLTTVYPDGSGLLSYGTNDAFNGGNLYYVQFKNGQILKQRRRYFDNTAQPIEVYGGFIGMQLPGGGEMSIKMLYDDTQLTGNIEFRQLHLSDSSSDCLGVDDNNIIVEPFRYKTASWTLDSLGENDIQVSTNKTITSRLETLAYKPGCQQITLCDSLKLVSDHDTICNNTPLLVTIRKNKSCNATVRLDFRDAPVYASTLLNDSTYELKFSNSWKGSILGTINGCSVLIDSIHVNVLAAAGKPDLGPDLSLCPGEKITLHAGNQYAAYQWQNGSTDSVIKADTPGTYRLQVKDACGSFFGDTVIVKQAIIADFPPLKDTIACMNELVPIKAGTGLDKYSWTNNLSQDTISTEGFEFLATKDITYFLTAGNSAGCFIKDTINVFVPYLQKISLGNDTSFCEGGQIILDGGPGFMDYTWNNGVKDRKITVKDAGTWSVLARDTNGCYIKDSLIVLAVYSRPNVMLDKNPALCLNGTRELDAGNFPNYLWQDGSQNRTININKPGIYHVTVISENGCIGADTTDINLSIPQPANFLPGDTSFCFYNKFNIIPTNEFEDYQWNTGSTAKSITISTGGLFWLNVKDKNGCSGRDSISLRQIDCLLGFYMPNSFSPNHDGKNDIFKPIVAGPLETYHFTIYNRFGEKVFETTDPFKGWDGTINTKQNDTNGFAWTCTYQFTGQPVKVEKGMVLMIR